MSYQQQPTGGFTVRSAPAAQQQGTYPSQAGGAGYQEYMKQDGQVQGENEEDVRNSTATRHMIFGVIEISAGLASNFIQIGTTIFSFMQIQLGIENRIFDRYGMWGGYRYVAATLPAYVWVSFVMAIGAQILLQAGCQILSRSWKKEQQAAAQQTQQQRYGFVQVLLSKEAGWFFTGLGFVLDAVGDLGFAIAFGIPWYVCILFGLIMNGLSTFVLYDGDERFHYAYPLWWTMYTMRKVWRQAALERARLMHGVSRDGRALVPQSR